MAIYFTSDTHFGHKKVLDFTGRPWETIDEMNQALVDNINARVGADDDLYILGDFSFRINVEEARALRDRIRCRKVHLLAGNHDRDWTRKEVAGTFICEPPIKTLKIDGRRYVLSHYPIADWQGFTHWSIHLHGHIHAGPDYNEFERAQRLLRYDVGVDANGYAPVSLEEVIAFFDGIEPRVRVRWPQWAPLAAEDATDC